MQFSLTQSFNDQWERLSAVKQQAVIAAPSTGLILTGVFEWPLEKWSLALGMVFVAAQLGHLLWRWWRDLRIERERRQGQSPEREGTQ